MNIKAQTTYNLRVYQGLSRLELFKNKNPKKWIVGISVGGIVLAAAFVLLGIFAVKQGSFSLLAVIPAGITAVMLFEYFVEPWYKYKSAENMADLMNTFYFRDNEVEMISESGGYHGKCVFTYAALHRVVETDDFIFLCQDKTKIYVVDKEVVEDSDEDVIRARIREVIGDRYIRCNY